MPIASHNEKPKEEDGAQKCPLKVAVFVTKQQKYIDTM